MAAGCDAVNPEAGADWQAWVGRTETRTETLSPQPVQALAATLLDAAWPADPGTPLPPLWHWVSFLPTVPMHQIGSDGHPKRGGFLPPIPLDRRMWAGGRLVFHAPLHVGEAVERHSEITRVADKSGKAGPMVFVTVRHRLSGPQGLAVDEEQDIVYLPLPTEFRYPEPVPVAADAAWCEDFPVDPVRLFRFSAVTFNGHRIHYDRDYAQQVEKYPGLVVHGPFQAMALMASAERHCPERVPRHFSFRGRRPLFDFDRITCRGFADDGAHDLATATQEGHTGMSARVQWA